MAQSGADRIERDVADHLVQMTVVLDQLCAVPPLEEVAYPLMPLVRSVCVHAVEPLHSLGDVGLWRFDQQVIVIVHEAERVHSPAMEKTGASERVEEHVAVVFGEEDRPSVVASHRDVVNAAGGLYSSVAGHGPKLPA